MVPGHRGLEWLIGGGYQSAAFSVWRLGEGGVVQPGPLVSEEHPEHSGPCSLQ